MTAPGPPRLCRRLRWLCAVRRDPVKNWPRAALRPLTGQGRTVAPGRVFASRRVDRAAGLGPLGESRRPGSAIRPCCASVGEIPAVQPDGSHPPILYLPEARRHRQGVPGFRGCRFPHLVASESKYIC